MAKKRKRKPIPSANDFRKILELANYGLDTFLRQMFHLTEIQWSLVLSKIEQGEAYHEWSFYKGHGKGHRNIAAPCDELKLAQEAILNQFLVQIPIHFARFGVLKGKQGSHLANAEWHRGAQSAYEVDLVNAFPTVKRSRVNKVLHGPFTSRLKQFGGKKFTTEEINVMFETVVDLLMFKDCLPQGAPTSSMLLAICSFALDQKLQELTQRDTIEGVQTFRYTAYADNLTFTSDGIITEETRSEITKIIRQNGFIPHSRADKTKYYDQSTGEVPIILGYVIDREGNITMSPRKKNQMRAILHQALLQDDWDVKFDETGNGTIRDKVHGVLAYAREIYPDKLPSALREVGTKCQERLAFDSANGKNPAKLITIKASGWTLFTDGGSKGNPREGAIGVALKRDNVVTETTAKRIGRATNNQAEYKALIEGLGLAITNGAKSLTVYMDSQLVVQQMNGEKTAKATKALYEEARQLADQLGDVTFVHIPREYNTFADGLVQSVLKAA